MHELRVTYIDELQFLEGETLIPSIVDSIVAINLAIKINGKEIFDKMEEKLKELKMNDRGTKLDYQLFNRENNNALIIALVSPLMERVHKMVSHFSSFNG